MDSNPILSASRIFDLLVNGRRIDREAAIAALNDPAQVIDHSTLRQLIIKALSQEFYPRRDDPEEDKPLAWTRSWLLSVLARVSNGDVEAARIVRNHLDPEYEPDYWVRHWTLEGLVSAGVPDLEQLARKIEEKEEEPLVQKLAIAILASKGDGKSKQEILEGLNKPELQWATLRALRIIFIPAAVKRICEIIYRGENHDRTYDAIIALGQIPSTSPHTESAIQVLSNFVMEVRHSPWRDGMRTKALRVLGNLRVESTGPLLIEELRDGNPAIVREAALALEKVLGIRTAVTRIIEAANKASRSHIEGFVSALRWMNRDYVVEELETAMVSGSADQQETARILLSEIGGMAAFQKLQARTKSIIQYTTELEKAEEKIRKLFETSIEEAHRGFLLATLMDIIVFFLGIGLLAISAGLILFKGGTLDSWVGIGLTGGTGVLGVVYVILIAKPRHQVQEAVDHLMHLKVIFLAYLRQLHQADQAYTRRLLEDKPLTSQEVDDFSNMVGTTMRIAIEQLTLSKPTKSEDEPKARYKDESLVPEDILLADIKK